MPETRLLCRARLLVRCHSCVVPGDYIQKVGVQETLSLAVIVMDGWLKNRLDEQYVTRLESL
jgi:hypothetical protein